MLLDKAKYADEKLSFLICKHLYNKIIEAKNNQMYIKLLKAIVDIYHGSCSGTTGKLALIFQEKISIMDRESRKDYDCAREMVNKIWDYEQMSFLKYVAKIQTRGFTANYQIPEDLLKKIVDCYRLLGRPN